MKSVCIICGGKSHEHEISLLSATSVLREIDRSRYEVHTVIIDEDGQFFCSEQAEAGVVLSGGGWRALADLRPAWVVPDPSLCGYLRQEENGALTRILVDVFFPVLHGENGEDGVIQGLLKMTGIPYVGSGVLSSASCMDKEVTHVRLDAAGIATAPYIVVRQGEESAAQVDTRLRERIGYPAFVKPANAGSSVGVSRVNGPEELAVALQNAFSVDLKVLIEACIIGAEVECAVIGCEQPQAAEVVGQIAPAASFYDYDAKYTDNSTQLYIPARISEETAEKIRKTALWAYRVMDCAGLARVDFFALPDGRVLLNEINNIPGFTAISMYPKLFEASGVGYRELIDRLIESAAVK